MMKTEREIKFNEVLDEHYVLKNINTQVKETQKPPSWIKRNPYLNTSETEEH